MLLSDVCLTVCLTGNYNIILYIVPNSRTERPRKIEISTELAHITCDADTIFKVKGSSCS